MAAVLAEAGLPPSRVFWEYICWRVAIRVCKNSKNPARDIMLGGMAGTGLRVKADAVLGENVGRVVRDLTGSWGSPYLAYQVER